MGRIHYVLPLTSVSDGFYLYSLFFVFNQLKITLLTVAQSFNDFLVLGRIPLAENLCLLQRNSHGAYLLPYLKCLYVRYEPEVISLSLDEQC